MDSPYNFPVSGTNPWTKEMRSNTTYAWTCITPGAIPTVMGPESVRPTCARNPSGTLGFELYINVYLQYH